MNEARLSSHYRGEAALRSTGRGVSNGFSNGLHRPGRAPIGMLHRVLIASGAGLFKLLHRSPNSAIRSGRDRDGVAEFR